jgi:hypothetical protein
MAGKTDLYRLFLLVAILWQLSILVSQKNNE